MVLLYDTRVVELSSQIAGSYCTKMLRDAGAEVIKLEPASGDPLRRWTASEIDLEQEDGALFRYLNAGKKSIASSSDLSLHDDLLGNADLLVEDGFQR